MKDGLSRRGFGRMSIGAAAGIFASVRAWPSPCDEYPWNLSIDEPCKLDALLIGDSTFGELFETPLNEFLLNGISRVDDREVAYLPLNPLLAFADALPDRYSLRDLYVEKTSEWESKPGHSVVDAATVLASQMTLPFFHLDDETQRAPVAEFFARTNPGFLDRFGGIRYKDLFCWPRRAFSLADLELIRETKSLYILTTRSTRIEGKPSGNDKCCDTQQNICVNGSTDDYCDMIGEQQCSAMSDPC